MSLRDWAGNGWIREHATTPQEIGDLFAVVERDLGDARVPRLSADWRLNITYNAALQLATLAMYAEGFRPGRDRAHERAILSLEYTVGARSQVIDLVDRARRKRNQANYEVAGSTSDREAEEFFAVVDELRSDMVRWLKKKHPALLPDDIRPNRLKGRGLPLV